MPIHNPIVRKVYSLAALLTGTFALCLQFALIMINAPKVGAGYVKEIIRFFSYMTILSNILVVLFFFYQLYNPKGRIGMFFRTASVAGAIFLYIFIVALVNHIALANLFQFTGYQFFVDKLLHYVMPAVYMIYWIFFIKKSPLPYSHIFYWVLFPLFYVIYILIRGTISHDYPYPFLDVSAQGYPTVLVNMAVVTGAYLLTGITLLFLNNRMLANREPITV